MKKPRANTAKSADRIGLTEALANGAARILPHVKLPVWMEMELACAILAEGGRRHQPSHH